MEFQAGNVKLEVVALFAASAAVPGDYLVTPTPW